MDVLETEVLVVGAGPVGVTLGLLLAGLGVSAAVIDKRTTVSLRSTGRMSGGSAQPAQLRREAKRAAPRMAAACADERSFSTAKQLPAYGNEIGINLDNIPDMDEAKHDRSATLCHRLAATALSRALACGSTCQTWNASPPGSSNSCTPAGGSWRVRTQKASGRYREATSPLTLS